MGWRDRVWRWLGGAARSYDEVSWLPYWTGGYTYPDADIAATHSGYAAAYTVVSAVYRAINIRADALDALPWVVRRYYGTGDQYEVVASDKSPLTHPLGVAIARHRIGLGKSFFKALAVNYDLHGERYVEIAHSRVTHRVEFKVLNSLWVTPQIGADGTISGYYYGSSRGQMVSLPPECVAYDATFNPFDDVRGLSLVQVALDSINIDRNLKRFLRDYFVNNARPGLVITPEGELNALSAEQRARIIAELQNFHRGSGGQYGTLVVEKPVRATPLDQPDLAGNIPLADAIRREVFTTFGVPISMAGDDQATTYKQGREVYENFVANTILPLARDTADFVQTQLMPLCADERVDMFMFDTSHLEYVSDAKLATHQLARDDYNAGVITLNESRALLGMPPIEGGDRLVPGKEVVADVPAMGAALRAYDEIDFTPTLEMADEAIKALRWRDQYGRGGTAVGVARARDLANRRRLSPQTVRRMASYFARHEGDREATGWRPGEEGFPSAGRIAWGLWGGDPGRDWAARKVEQMARADATAARDPYRGVNLLDMNAHEALRLGVRPDRYSQAAALDELEAWRRFWQKRAERAGGRPFEALVLRGPIAAEVADALAVGDVGVFDRVRARLAPDWLGAVGACVRGMNRYDQIDFTVPALVKQEVQQAVEWRRALGRGEYDDLPKALLGERLTVEQARDLAAWFQGHSARVDEPGWLPGSEGYPSTARINWGLRGGDAGRDWAGALAEQIRQADQTLDDVKEGFGAEFLPLLALIASGVVGDAAARKRIREMIERFAFMAYRAGLAEGGVLDDLTAKQVARVQQMLARQQRFIDEFVDELMSARLSEAEMEQRVRLWAAGAFAPLYNEGVSDAGENGLYMWIEGDTVNKCVDCVRLDGQIHRWEEYRERNLLPQTPGQATECEGWQCRCQLVPVVGRTRGGW